MEHDSVEIGGVEQSMSAHGSVLRGDRLERPPREVAGEDDVHDVLRAEPALR